jgi:hypothetical protein
MAAAHTTRRRKIAALSFDPLRFYRGEPLTFLEWCFCVTVTVVITVVAFTRVWVLISLRVVSAVELSGRTLRIQERDPTTGRS